MRLTMEPELVRSADDMDDETFAAHMALRHSDSLGGLKTIGSSLANPGLTKAWRAFHRRLHRLRIDLEHEHSESRTNREKTA